MAFSKDGPRIATNAKAIRRLGKARMISMVRMITFSINPLLKAAIRPRKTPTVRQKKITIKPI